MNILYSIGGILIPFIGTSFGSSFVFFMKKSMSENFQKIIVGFASGVMIAASVWSLILPAVEMAENQGIISWIPATVGLLLGVIFLLFINKIAEKFENKPNGKKLNMLLFSVTLHNIPEGRFQKRTSGEMYAWEDLNSWSYEMDRRKAQADMWNVFGLCLFLILKVYIIN